MQGVVAAATGSILTPVVANTLSVAPTAAESNRVSFEFTLPQLPYACDALAPVIDEMTMTIHHTKHHQAYINNLNTALKDHPDLAGKTVNDLLKGLADLPESIRTAVRNNGGGHANHSLFWTWMRAPQENNAPAGELAEAIVSKFGSFEKFQEAFAKKAMGQFGSGWAWLVAGKSGLDVVSTPNQDTPVMEGNQPLLGIDVWEHAYYLNYQNKRADYVAAWWKVVNWDEVAKGFRQSP
jgi:superoxide dismutase, Fe-Mn family